MQVDQMERENRVLKTTKSVIPAQKMLSTANSSAMV